LNRSNKLFSVIAGLKKEKSGYFQSFLPVNSQTTINITAITSSICINDPTPGKAKKPTNQRTTRIRTIATIVFIKYPFYLQRYVPNGA
jgi:hypothetical protein